jgi:hypothetical protein
MRGRRAFYATVALCALGALVPATSIASSISGTVADQGSHLGIGGVEVCPTPQPYVFETSCTETDSGGHYVLSGLPGGSYTVFFSANRNNLKYVSEFYTGKRYDWEADLLSLGASENRSLDVELVEGGSIGGAVTDETSGLPIAGIRACAIDHEGIPTRCSDTDGSGGYALNGLPSGEYSVEFEGGNRVNYLREFYEDAETWAAATKVSVTAPVATTGIDDELGPGAQIIGQVSQVGTGLPLPNVFVCAIEPAPGERQGCDTTDSAGDYAIRSLEGSTYLVAFELEYQPTGPLAPQWWNGASSMADADPIAIAPPETRTGIDGQLNKQDWPPAPVKSSPPPPAAVHDPRPHGCKKRFQHKTVKGEARCVRKHKHRRHR